MLNITFFQYKYRLTAAHCSFKLHAHRTRGKLTSNLTFKMYCQLHSLLFNIHFQFTVCPAMNIEYYIPKLSVWCDLFCSTLSGLMFIAVYTHVHSEPWKWILSSKLRSWLHFKRKVLVNIHLILWTCSFKTQWVAQSRFLW